MILRKLFILFCIHIFFLNTKQQQHEQKEYQQQ